MRLADHDGRAVLLVEGGGIDVATASDGRFGPDIQALYDDWPAFVAFAAEVVTHGSPTVEVDESRFGNPAPRPRQVFAIGLNYRAHAAESGVEVPSTPAMWAQPSASATRSARAPTTTTSSTSQSTLPLGSATSASGPARQAGNFVNVAGVPGTSTPDSAAWAR